MRERTRSKDIKIDNYRLDSYDGQDDACESQHEDYTDWTFEEGPHVSKNSYEIMHDVVTPNFHQLSSAGKIVNSPMDRTIVVNEDPLVSIVSSWEHSVLHGACDPPSWWRTTALREGTLPSSNYTGGIEQLPAQPSIDVESLIAQAVTQAHANASLTQAQGLVMIAEGKKTVLGLQSIFFRLIKILRKVKRLDAKGLLGELSPKELADRYMELRYALRPLMYDVTESVNLLNKADDSAKLRQTFRGFSKDTAESSDVTPWISTWGTAPNIWSRNATQIKTAQRTVEVRAGVLTELQGKASTLASWGLTEPVEALWELVPFSFVVDWFFNVGDTIASFTPNYGLNDLSSWYVVKDVTYRETRFTDAYGEAPEAWQYNEPQFNVFSLGPCYTSQLTTVITRVPDPVRRMLPSFSLNLDVFKLTDLIIIAKQIWR